MSLAGAGQSPRNVADRPPAKAAPPPKANHGFALYCRQAIPAARRNLPPTKASRQTCAIPPSGGHRRRRNRTQKAKQKFCARIGSREEVPCGCRAEPANPCRQAPGVSRFRTPTANHGFALYCRQAIPAARRSHPQQSKPHGLRHTAVRRSLAVRRSHPQQSKPTGLPFPLSPVLFPLCAAFRFFLSSLPFLPTSISPRLYSFPCSRSRHFPQDKGI